MTLLELSGEYRASAAALRERVLLLEHRLRGVDGDGRRLLEGRIRLLRAMGREARELAVLCERYYERGTAAMANTRYRRGGAYAADMAVYARAMAADNSAQLSRVKRNLVRALREDVTPRQREVLLLYYAEQLNTRQIGESWGGQVHRSPHHQAGRPGCAAACGTARRPF
ncbi:hypothetical protein M5E87_13420 [Flavonifractor plautii]|nr:hypothetical protein M5E87_13420 [Flavonifractor plautii]